MFKSLSLTIMMAFATMGSSFAQGFDPNLHSTKQVVRMKLWYEGLETIDVKVLKAEQNRLAKQQVKELPEEISRVLDRL